ncbi:uncharacterized protein LOC110853751 isoform X1 [Folsomia candida]|uniref:Transmembrane protein n=1 Tax=Folsomia candida TaxID=158441 RepID=A0A226DY57_FOLCA|nr:uncharacterized protein LOC110853751 isoform X1 [Folsomia candida]OXA50392.1 hypothetical protein Fcan01_15260 [Folsomia candida]
MKCHPFCGGKISSKLKLLIAFDIIVSAILLQLAIIWIFFFLGFHFEVIPPSDEFIKDATLMGMHSSTVVIFVVFLIIDVMLDVWLWIILPKKDKSRIQVWFIIKVSLELCDAVGFSVEVIFGHHTSIYIAPMIANFLFTAFFLWVVYVFMVELHKTPKTILLEGNKFVKFFKTGGHRRSSGFGDDETVLNSVMDD